MPGTHLVDYIIDYVAPHCLAKGIFVCGCCKSGCIGRVAVGTLFQPDITMLIVIVNSKLIERYYLKQSFSTGVSHEEMEYRDKEEKKTQCQDQCQCVMCPNLSLANMHGAK